MDQMLELAKGAFFKFSLLIMILGLVRLAALTIWGMVRALNRTLDKNVPYGKLIKETLSWLFPIKSITESRILFSIVSFIFHIGLIVVPLFFLDHILLWRAGTGMSWPNIPRIIADALTLTTIFGGIFLFGSRIFHRDSRFLSKFPDYFLLILILFVFISGFIASRPYNPLAYNTTMFIHVICGDLILILIPFTKLAHCLLFPIVRIASNIAWRFPARAGEKINQTLYGEEIRKI